MKISIAFSGPAGKGINTVGLLVGELLSKKGYFVVGDKEYASIIKGDNNLFVLYISDKQYYLSQKIDHFFSCDDYGLQKNQKVYNIQNVYSPNHEGISYINTYFFGNSLKLLGIDLKEGIDLISTKFKGDKLEINIKELTNGYSNFDNTAINLSAVIGPAKEFTYGNEMIGKGAIDSGLEFYSAYPMTPASTLIDVIITDPKVTFFQGEDEIAVAMSMLGAKFAGKRSMCGTSGGGFALMTESISYSNQAELGGVYILSQRAGPSTGTPTFTEQSDLLYAVNASFGDTKPLVLMPSTYEEGYNMIGKALNWSDIYQHPVIVLLDKQYSESHVSVDLSKLVAEPVSKGNIAEDIQEGFARYQYSENGISPYSVPGTPNGDYIATSYEHDIYGDTTEDPNVKKLMTEKRFKKLETFVKQEFNDSFVGFEIINPNASKFFVTIGFTRYLIESFVEDKSEYGCIVIKSLSPVDQRLKHFLEENYTNIEKLIFVEYNYSGQLEYILKSELQLDSSNWKNKITNFRKYDLYPIFEEQLGEII